MNSETLYLDRTFAALSDPYRRSILARLAQGPADVAELTAPSGISQPAVSRHLKVLERAGLIAVQPVGTKRRRVLVLEPLRELDHWLESYRTAWEARFARLDAVLDGRAADAADLMKDIST